jgi:hypothetical protein
LLVSQLALAGIVWVDSLSSGRSNEPSRTLTLALISVGLSALFGGSVIATRLERFQFLFGRKWGWAIIIIIFSHGLGFITKVVNFTGTTASSVVSVILLSILFIVFVEVLLSVEIPLIPWKAFVSSMVALAIASAILSYLGYAFPLAISANPLVLPFVAFNIFDDGVSLWETRWVLKREPPLECQNWLVYSS